MSTRVLWTEAQLVFIHVPKAAGTTLTAILDHQFMKEQICPAYYWKELFVIPRSKLLSYQLIRGHFEYSITELLRDVMVITMLREPIARAVSYYRFIRSSKAHPLHEMFQHLALADVLADKELSEPLTNHQTELFGRDLDLEQMRRNMSPEAPCLYPWSNRPGRRAVSLQRAKERLASCAFVGIQERFEDSLLLLAYTFGWEPPKVVKSLNVTPTGGKSEEISDAEMVALREKNVLDLELYSFARDVFERRFQEMVEEVAAFAGRDSRSIQREELAQLLRHED